MRTQHACPVVVRRFTEHVEFWLGPRPRPADQQMTLSVWQVPSVQK